MSKFQQTSFINTFHSGDANMYHDPENFFLNLKEWHWLNMWQDKRHCKMYGPVEFVNTVEMGKSENKDWLLI